MAISTNTSTLWCGKTGRRKPVGLQSVSITLDDTQEQKPSKVSRTRLKANSPTRYFRDPASKQRSDSREHGRHNRLYWDKHHPEQGDDDPISAIGVWTCDAAATNIRRSVTVYLVIELSLLLLGAVVLRNRWTVYRRIGRLYTRFLGFNLTSRISTYQRSMLASSHPKHGTYSV
jgi:hypothetical protein